MMRELLLTTASLINEIKSGFPIGCNGFNEKGGYYVANDISKVGSLNDNVRAHNGFIQDGLMVKFNEQFKAVKGSKYRGYRASFDLTGKYNGPLSLFTRSEQQYKMYFDPEAWNIAKKEITYKPIEGEDGEEFKRTYIEPQVMDFETNEWRYADKNSSIMAKVKFALDNKLKSFEAYDGDVKLFDEESI